MRLEKCKIVSFLMQVHWRHGEDLPLAGCKSLCCDIGFVGYILIFYNPSRMQLQGGNDIRLEKFLENVRFL